MAHENPYPPSPTPPSRARLSYSEAWKRLVALAGLIGCGVLLMRPELRSLEAWIVSGGAAGIVPVDRLLDRFGIGSTR